MTKLKHSTDWDEWSSFSNWRWVITRDYKVYMGEYGTHYDLIRNMVGFDAADAYEPSDPRFQDFNPFLTGGFLYPPANEISIVRTAGEPKFSDEEVMRMAQAIAEEGKNFGFDLFNVKFNDEGGTKSFKLSNIMDPIQPELDQTVFEGIEVRDEIARFLTENFDLAASMHGYNPDDFDLYLTGSLTTYQYSDTSDCDVSVFPLWDRFEDPKQTRKELVTMVINEVDGTILPDTTHPVQNFVNSVGSVPEDRFKVGMRSGYNLRTREWLVPPEKERAHDVALEYPDIYARAQEMATKMEDALDHDPDAARELFEQIHLKRRLDEEAGLGDFSEGNIVYKWLLHQGLFDRIRNDLGVYIASVYEGQYVVPGNYEDGNSYKFLWVPALNQIRVWQDQEYGGIDVSEDAGLMAHFAVLNEIFGEMPKDLYWNAYKQQYADRALEEVVMGVIYNRHNNDEEEYWPDDVSIEIYEQDYESEESLMVDKASLLAALKLPADTVIFSSQGDDVMTAKVSAEPREDSLSRAEILDFLVGQIRGSRGMVDSVRRFFVDNSILYDPDIRNDLVDEAYEIYLLEEDQNKQRADQLRQELDQFHASWTEYRWAWVDGKVMVQNVSTPDLWKKNVHYDMLVALNGNDNMMWNDKSETVIQSDRVYLGYADINDEGQIEFTDPSMDYYEDREVPINVRSDVARAIRGDMGIVTSKTERHYVHYNFDADHITLGKTSETDDPHNIVVGEYWNDTVVLYPRAHQWMNPNYFRRLWHHSYPTKTMTSVVFEQAPPKVAREPKYVQPFIERLYPNEVHNAGGECPNPKCDYVLTMEDKAGIDQTGEFECPRCGYFYDYEAETLNLNGNLPGGKTRASISMKQMGDIGEGIVGDKLKGLPGIGEVVWQSIDYNDPIDMIIGDYACEIKTNHSEAQPRFKLGDSRERNKKIQKAAELGLKQGFIGIRLNFYTDKADVFFRPQFSDFWIGMPGTQHIATVDFDDLNPFRSPDAVPPPQYMPDDDSDIPF